MADERYIKMNKYLKKSKDNVKKALSECDNILGSYCNGNIQNCPFRSDKQCIAHLYIDLYNIKEQS